jgi:hypothetical protein
MIQRIAALSAEILQRDVLLVRQKPVDRPGGVVGDIERSVRARKNGIHDARPNLEPSGFWNPLTRSTR